MGFLLHKFRKVLEAYGMIIAAICILKQLAHSIPHLS